MKEDYQVVDMPESQQEPRIKYDGILKLPVGKAARYEAASRGEAARIGNNAQQSLRYYRTGRKCHRHVVKEGDILQFMCGSNTTRQSKRLTGSRRKHEMLVLQ